MRTILFINIVLVGAVLANGCSGNPLAPKSYTCKTQARIYTLVDGTVQLESDTYVQDSPCPASPIA